MKHDNYININVSEGYVQSLQNDRFDIDDLLGDLEGQILSGIYKHPISHTKCELSMKKVWH